MQSLFNLRRRKLSEVSHGQTVTGQVVSRGVHPKTHLLMLLPSGSVGAPGNVISGGERPVSYGESNSGADCRGPAQWEAVQGGGVWNQPAGGQSRPCLRVVT